MATLTASRSLVGALLGATALLGFGLTLGSGPTGCIYPDSCIRVNSSGHDWCSNMANAQQWPAGGSFEDAQPILRPDGGTPRGCRCFNDAEHQVLEDGVPECHLTELWDEVETATRQECQSLVLPGFDHNCWTISGPQASSVEDPFREGPGSCIGNCEYGGPPAGGSCPELNPYECATGDGGGACAQGDQSGDDTGAVETTGGDSEGVTPAQGTIACDGNECTVARAFAAQLYDDPSLLLSQSARLVYDAKSRRHGFIGVFPGTIAHALGFRTNDILESVNGTTIHDLDSALEAYVALRDALVLQVRVERDSQWVDLVITIGP